VLTEVPAAEAARLLHAKSHRAATGEEIAAHLEQQSAAVRQEFHEALRRQGIAIVSMPGKATLPEKTAPAEKAAAETDVRPTGPKARLRILR
jgi:biotin operon repressor